MKRVLALILSFSLFTGSLASPLPFPDESDQSRTLNNSEALGKVLVQYGGERIRSYGRNYCKAVGWSLSGTLLNIKPENLTESDSLTSIQRRQNAAVYFEACSKDVSCAARLRSGSPNHEAKLYSKITRFVKGTSVDTQVVCPANYIPLFTVHFEEDKEKPDATGGSMDECSAKCESSSCCVGFSWNMADNECFIKKSVDFTNVSIDPNYISFIHDQRLEELMGTKQCNASTVLSL